MNNLIIFVEGPDDLNFFSNIFEPLFIKDFENIKILTYGGKTTKSVNNYVKSIRAMEDKLIIQADYDNSPCYTNKIEKLLEKYRRLIKEDVIISKKMIEGWYIAGLNIKVQRDIKLKKVITNTNDLDKNQFNSIIPDGKSRSDIMKEMLNKYNLECACVQNISMDYFCKKWLSD